MLANIVVECWSAPMTWTEVWRHQVRWARTIRVCQPLPYFFSILNNATLWPLLWLAFQPSVWSTAFVVFAALVRMWSAMDLQRRLCEQPVTSTCPAPGNTLKSGQADSSKRDAKDCPPAHCLWLALVKDLLQVAVWLSAFAGNRIVWRNHKMRLRRDGTLVRID